MVEGLCRERCLQRLGRDPLLQGGVYRGLRKATEVSKVVVDGSYDQGHNYLYSVSLCKTWYLGGG